jgi:hypothetical protein
MSVQAPDLSVTPPRSGRVQLGSYVWLARMADKIRAVQAGTAGDYIGFCGLSKGFLERCGVTVDDFDQLIATGATDAELVTFFDRHVDADHRELANTFVLVEKRENIAQQDAEEGHTAA